METRQSNKLFLVPNFSETSSKTFPLPSFFHKFFKCRELQLHGFVVESARILELGKGQANSGNAWILRKFEHTSPPS